MSEDNQHLPENDDELKELISQIWGTRRDRYSEKRTELSQQPKSSNQDTAPKKVEMYQIGG